jgi:putative ABC transport system permease protein
VLTMLRRKLLRDLARMGGQAAAIALLVACAMTVFVGSVSTYRSLELGQRNYYDRFRFAEVFASSVRAPETLTARIAAVPGVAEAETRVVTEAPLEVDGFAEPASARLMSMPSDGRARLNQLYLRAGRTLDPAEPWGVVASEAFVTAHGLGPGDSLTVVIRGRKQRLHILGVALSPEHVLQIRPGDLLPDDRRYGVFWMQREPLAAALGLEGAFNDLSARLVPGASEPAVLAELDRLLSPYGGVGAYGRSSQISHRYLTDEILQLRATAIVVPAVFLGVAAFLLNIVLGRLVATQREQIATLKALGYSSWAVGRHFAELVLLISVVGAGLGCLGGVAMGSGLTDVYAQFYRLPLAVHQVEPSLIAIALGVSAAAALAAVVGAVARAVRLPPAAAMRPEAPTTFRPTPLERLGFARLLSPSGRMALRNMGRRPVRALLTTVGMALAVAMLVVGSFFQDAMDVLLDVSFRSAERGDATVAFAEALPSDALDEVRRLPGVLDAEPFRSVPVRLHAGHRTRTTALTALLPDARLRRVVGLEQGPVSLPTEGLLLTDTLAALLRVAPGDSLAVEWLEGDRRRREVAVAAVVDEPLGTSAYMSFAALHQLLGEQDRVSGAFLAVDAAEQTELLARLRKLPKVAGVLQSASTIATFQGTNAQYILLFAAILMGFAGLIAIAVVYNSARILLAERERELATLRVLGLSAGEVFRIVLGELGAQAALSVPLGWAIGRIFSQAAADGASNEMFRIPAVISAGTYLSAAAVLGAAFALVALSVRHRVARLDLVTVLKTKE